MFLPRSNAVLLSASSSLAAIPQLSRPVVFACGTFLGRRCMYVECLADDAVFWVCWRPQICIGPCKGLEPRTGMFPPIVLIPYAGTLAHLRILFIQHCTKTKMLATSTSSTNEYGRSHAHVQFTYIRGFIPMYMLRVFPVSICCFLM